MDTIDDVIQDVSSTHKNSIIKSIDFIMHGTAVIVNVTRKFCDNVYLTQIIYRHSDTNNCWILD